MKKAFWPIAALAIVASVVGCVVFVSGRQDRAMAAPPLSLEGLLDEKLPESTGDEPKLKVDNGPCYVCHGNYREESLVVKHGKHEISCIDCHGESEAHRNDEDNITPPDTMYALADVDKKCGECHDDHDVTARDVIARWQQRCPKKTNPKEIACTDCHFQHRLKFRTVWWDKRTRELIIRKEGERIKKADDGGAQATEGESGSSG